MDRYALYELCVQRPSVAVTFLARLHGQAPQRLHEDFCGSGAIARNWVASDPDRTAVGIDVDERVLEVAKKRARKVGESEERLRFVDAELGLHGEPLNQLSGERADVVFAGNFSIGELHTRVRLVSYLRSCVQRLQPGGICASDTYGGRNAFVTGVLARTVVPEEPDSDFKLGTVIRYGYEQVCADPFTGMVENHLHFEVIQGGEIVERHRSAFVYKWRLWSVPEIRDAMAEAGFRSTDVHWDLAIDGGKEINHAPETFAALIVGRM